MEAAAARGIDVLCQKPLTPTLAEAEALVARVGTRVRLMVHENWRFRPWYRELQRWIADGLLGEIDLARLATISSGFLPDEQGRRPAFVRQPFMAREPRLMIAEVLIHHLDTMRFLCGPLRVVGARASRTLADVTGETFAAIFLETADGRARVRDRHDGRARLPAPPPGPARAGRPPGQRGPGRQRAAAPRPEPADASATTRTRATRRASTA